MWGSRYFTARYWTSRYWTATGSSLPPGEDLFGGYVPSLISDAGKGVLCNMQITGYSSSLIVSNSGLISEITSDPNGSISFIDDTGNGIESLIL